MLPFDLHVLGLPPAFNLSHDQTLHFKFFFMTCFSLTFNFFDVSLITQVFFFFALALSAHTDCLYCFVKELHVFAVTTGAYITAFFFSLQYLF